VNPGGPGGSGLIYAILGQFVPKHAGDTYDWIGFDPRGVGSSKPAISCDPNYFVGPRPPFRPTTDAYLNAWLTRSKNYAQACADDAGALLDHMKTTDVAHDLDTIREALGAPQINYYGYSYGTYLGQVYSTLFPSHVRRIVLDSNVDPRFVFYKANLHQDVAFERNINIWFGWLAKYNSVYHLGATENTVRRLFYKAENALTKDPAGGVVGPDEWDDAFLTAGYSQSSWTDLGDVFSSWVHDHDTAKLIAAYQNADGPGDDNLFAVYNAVQCTDAPWPQKWSKWARDNWQTDRIAPFETWGNAWFNAPCLYWPAAAHTAVSVDGTDVAALLVDQTLDGATPYSGSLEVRKLFPKSSLIAIPGGTTHADSLFDNIPCVDNQIANYLAKGTLPDRKPGNGPDTTCAAAPQPVPGETASSSAASALRKALVPRFR
jgi:pimeloyl-ACP methyl ester carboxylesterase